MKRGTPGLTVYLADIRFTGMDVTPRRSPLSSSSTARFPPGPVPDGHSERRFRVRNRKERRIRSGTDALLWIQKQPAVKSSQIRWLFSPCVNLEDIALRDTLKIGLKIPPTTTPCCCA